MYNFNIILNPGTLTYRVQYVEQDKTTDVDLVFKSEDQARQWCDEYAKKVESTYKFRPLIIPYQVILGEARVLDATTVTEVKV